VYLGRLQAKNIAMQFALERSADLSMMSKASVSQKNWKSEFFWRVQSDY